MGWSRPTIAATALLAVLALAAPAGAGDAGGHRERPRPMTIEAHGATARATLGSYCVSRGRTGLCADAAYPLRVREGLRVGPGDLVTLRTGDRAIGRVTLRLLLVRGHAIHETGWTARGERVGERPRRFRFELPAHVGRANRLDVFVRYRERIGDADYWVRLVR